MVKNYETWMTRVSGLLLCGVGMKVIDSPIVSTLKFGLIDFGEHHIIIGICILFAGIYVFKRTAMNSNVVNSGP